MTDNERLKISGSNLDTFYTCEYKFLYGTLMNLTPLELPEPMQLGTFGHRMMEEFFKVIMAGGTYEEAATAAGALIQEILDKPQYGSVYRHVLAFGQWFLEQPWRVIGIEEKGSTPVNDTLEFAFTPDLIIEWTMGPNKGKIAVLDYKFTGQYWNDREINMTQQIPKYIIFKNKRDGTNIRQGGVVMLNTRAAQGASGTGLFMIKWVPITKAKLDLIEKENLVLMDRVEKVWIEFDRDPVAAREMLTHTPNAKTCKMCWFADDLCPMEMNGRDASNTIKRRYKQNDYGYNGTKPPEEIAER